jgi:hypothetical protein
MPFNPHAMGVNNVLKWLSPLVRPMLNAPSARRLESAVNIADLRLAARQRAHRMVFDYLDAGADDEITLRRNKDAYSSLELHPRVLAGLKPPLDLSARFMRSECALPFFVSPTAGSKMFHADGEQGVARAAAKHGVMYSLSTMGTSAPAEVAAAIPPKHPKLFQLYVWKDRALVRDMLRQAMDNGFDALALTVDLTWYGNRERDVRNGFTVPPAYTLRQIADAVRAPAWSWDFLANEEYAYAAVKLAAEGAFYTLVPIRPRSRGERRSLRTLPGVSLRAPLAFNTRPRRLSTPTDAFELHPDVRLYGTTLTKAASAAAASRSPREKRTTRRRFPWTDARRWRSYATRSIRRSTGTTRSGS